ncbi:flap endonuclease-1 [archaeon]|jgi:flap endonuclease-1|nr:flap endonuclease-1 [archaeon]MBT6824067.1 flap endonuclease-1 [archaeon]MBT7297700.1 flap endonuclease-1 [archaeon]
MGVAISELIKKDEISFDQLKGKKLSVDASNVIYQFLASIRQMDGTPLMDSNNNVTSHIMGLSTRIPNLMEKGIKLCFVFDGEPPELKAAESKRRRDLKAVAAEKLEKAKKEKDIEAMSKYSRQTIKLTKDIKDESMEFIRALGLPVIQAPSEAEAQAAYMAEKGDVWGTLSQDVDALLYSTPRLIRNLTVSQKRKVRGNYIKVLPEIINLKDTLDSLGINNEQLLTLSILVGTDYNIGGVKGIGPKTGLKLVKEHKTIEKVFENVNADFDWKDIYNTFKEMKIKKDYKIEWKSPDQNKIREILSKHDFSEERINRLLEKLKPKKQKNLDNWF